jgi:hypothetical protein
VSELVLQPAEEHDPRIAPRPPRRHVGLGTVASCECGWRFSVAHAGYGRKTAERMVAQIVERHAERCRMRP